MDHIDIRSLLSTVNVHIDILNAIRQMVKINSAQTISIIKNIPLCDSTDVSQQADIQCEVMSMPWIRFWTFRGGRYKRGWSRADR